MEIAPIPPKTDPETSALYRHIFENAQGGVIDLSNLDSNPTTTGGELEDGQWGIYSGALYFTILGTTYKILLTSV